MKIKTICKPPDLFDEEVNQLLNQGWKILNNTFRLGRDYDERLLDLHLKNVEKEIDDVHNKYGNPLDPRIEQEIEELPDDLPDLTSDVYIIILYKD